MTEKANCAVHSFLSDLSHDLRTPLNGILGFADLASKTDDPVRKQEYPVKIPASGDVMLSLVKDVLDMSKTESGETELLPRAITGRSLLGRHCGFCASHGGKGTHLPGQFRVFAVFCFFNYSPIHGTAERRSVAVQEAEA